MRHCARLTCCTGFGRTHRSWFLLVWPSTSGMRLRCGFRRFDAKQLRRPRHLRCRSEQSRRKPEPALAHSASHKKEIKDKHNRKHVSELADLASATAESFHDRVADESKRQAVGN